MNQPDFQEATPQNEDMPRLLWHASRYDIDRPTLSGRVPGANHPNSGLGIFCATVPRDYLCMFGSYIHQIELVRNFRSVRMNVQDMSRMGRHEDRAWFEAQGRILAQRFDVIELVEIDGRIEQSIILCDKAIASSCRMSVEEYAKIMIRDPIKQSTPPRPF